MVSVLEVFRVGLLERTYHHVQCRGNRPVGPNEERGRHIPHRLSWYRIVVLRVLLPYGGLSSYLPAGPERHSGTRPPPVRTSTHE